MSRVLSARFDRIGEQLTGQASPGSRADIQLRLEARLASDPRTTTSLVGSVAEPKATYVGGVDIDQLVKAERHEWRQEIYVAAAGWILKACSLHLADGLDNQIILRRPSSKDAEQQTSQHITQKTEEK